MSNDRPEIFAEVLEQLIQSAPDRVRRRLDRDPAIATTWNWKRVEPGFIIAAGNETVSIDSDPIAIAGDVRCTCLLSPNCFHVLACVTTLDVGLAEPSESGAPITECKAQDDERTTELSPTQISAADSLRLALNRLLDIGLANAGIRLQSGVARAAHQCRVHGLHRAAASAIAIGQGVRELRSRDPAADAHRTATQIAGGLRIVHHLTKAASTDNAWIGTARRKQASVNVKKLFGLFAEPILTLTGYAGTVAYLAGDDGNLYTLSDVRPGDASLCDSTYRGGIEIGSTTQPAHKIVRSTYLVSKITASSDGRLGRGKNTSVVWQDDSDWDRDEIKQRFDVPISQQLNQILPFDSLPETDRPAGWDLLFFRATVMGGSNANVIVWTPEHDAIELAIAIDDERLPFRRNLRLLCHAPGLQLQIIARMDTNRGRRMIPLAIRPSRPQGSDHARLELPDESKQLVCLGLDRVERNFILNGSPEPTLVEFQPARREVPRELEILRRRWVSAATMGFETSNRLVTDSTAREVRLMAKAGFAFGASLLDALLREGTGKDDLFLAVDEYLNSCRRR